MSSLPSPVDLNQCTCSGIALAATLVGDAVNWASQLTAPASLVAGGLLTTIGFGFEERLSEQDSSREVFQKQVIRVLIVSAFALEVMSIFAACLIITSLLHVGPAAAEGFKGSAIEFLRAEFEVEYLATGVGFLQGLLQWLAAAALHLSLHEKDYVTRKTNQFLSCTVAGLVLTMIGMLNERVAFYGSYVGMLARCGQLLWENLFMR